MTAGPQLAFAPFDAPPAVVLDELPADAVVFYGRRSAPEWAWLSNFEGGPVELPDPHTGRTTTYPSKEHALMAHKTVTHEEHEAIRTAKDPRAAKARGRRVALRADWDDVKLGVMVEILRHWYAAHPERAAELVATGDALILEDSPTDAIWGIRTADGRLAGTNLLGRAHMAVRAELRERAA